MQKEVLNESLTQIKEGADKSETLKKTNNDECWDDGTTYAYSV
jgi:hypothetical protein